MAKTKPGAKAWKRPPRAEPVTPIRPAADEPEEFDITIHTPEEWAELLGAMAVRLVVLSHQLGVTDQLPKIIKDCIKQVREASEESASSPS